MANLFLPLSPAEAAQLPRDVERAWREVAPPLGVDPNVVNVFPGLGDNLLLVEEAVGDEWENVEPPFVFSLSRALSALALALADAPWFYSVDGLRVVGHAAVPEVTAVPFRPDDGLPICTGYMVGPDDGTSGLYPTPALAVAAWGKNPPLVALRDVAARDNRDPRVLAYLATLMARREELARSLAPGGQDARREHGRRAAMAHAESAARQDWTKRPREGR